MTISHESIQEEFGDFNFIFSAVYDSVMKLQGALRDYKSEQSENHV